MENTYKQGTPRALSKTKISVSKRKLKWIGHAQRKEGSLLETVLENVPQEKGPLGRLRLRQRGRRRNEACWYKLEGSNIEERKPKANTCWIQDLDNIMMSRTRIQSNYKYLIVFAISKSLYIFSFLVTNHSVIIHDCCNTRRVIIS